MAIVGWLVVATIALMAAVTAIEHVRNRSVRSVASRPPAPKVTMENQLLEALARGEELPAAGTDERIERICAYVDGRYDCSDFRAISLLRILYQYHARLSAGQRARIETCLASFKYWLD